jgi:hypothetical protein
MRLAIAASLAILAAFLAGCSTSPAPEARPVGVTPIDQPYRAGTGVVQAVTPAPGPIAAGPQTSATSPAAASSSPAAASGSPAKASTSGMQRLRIRMDDGRMMYVDTPSREIAVGQRVLLTDAKEMRIQ